MEASQRKLARERSNDALGELLQAIIYAKVDAADQENAGMLSLGVGNVRCLSFQRVIYLSACTAQADHEPHAF